MLTNSKWDRGELAEIIAGCRNGDTRRLNELGLQQIIIHSIVHILNNYSHIPPWFLHDLITCVLLTHAPQRSFIRLERFLESMRNGLPEIPVSHELPAILAKVFSASGVLSGRLISDISLITILAGLEKPLDHHPEKEYYHNHFHMQENDTEILTERVKMIHRIHTAHLMRICARNADPDIRIDQINSELSLLAEAVIGSCLAIAYLELSARVGIESRPHSLVVLGLGKLGGSELNVSSDIDLIYLCSDNDETWGHYDSINFHTMLAERLTRLLTEATDLGILYRVDTRLRADGASGPLVRAKSDYIRYLEMRGEAWERQMLLKARPVAGEIGIGQTFLASIERFIFPTSITRSPNREIVELKNRIESRMSLEGSKKTHLKLAPGGVRDIEFVVQCLQLLMGGIHPEVRCIGTMPSLMKLKKLNALTADEYMILSEAYTLYRRIENALQWRELLPAFTLPETREECDDLALFLGFQTCSQDPASKLLNVLERNMKAVREVYNDVFSISAYGSFEEMSIQAVRNPSGNEKVKRFMESLGFLNPIESALALSRLVYGDKGGIHDHVLHSSVSNFLPKFLRMIAELPDPGGALERFSRVVESYNARYTLFDILIANPEFFELILTITHGSVFITDIINRDPSLLDWLVALGGILHPIDVKGIQRELKHIDADAETDEQFTRACLALVNREKLRIGARDITGLATTEETFGEMTSVAECIVKEVYIRVYDYMCSNLDVPHEYAFSVLSAGRLGAGMMDFGSDLDLIFVYRESTKKTSGFEAPRISIKLAQHILYLITGGGGANKIFDVDARLRPEGGSSVLAVSIDEYKRYLENRASVWERLALIRTRPVGGSTRLGSEIVRTIHSFIYRAPFTREDLEKIMGIRSAMIENSHKRYPGLINVKSGAGGIADIDFIAQSYAAHYGYDVPSLQRRDTQSIIKALGSATIVSKHDVSTLLELYTFLCDVEKTLRIGSGRSVNTVPKTETEAARAARLIGFKNIRRFRKRLDDVTCLTENLYDRLMKDLLSNAGVDTKQP